MATNFNDVPHDQTTWIELIGPLRNVLRQCARIKRTGGVLVRHGSYFRSLPSNRSLLYSALLQAIAKILKSSFMGQTPSTLKYIFFETLMILWQYQSLSKSCWNYLGWHRTSMKNRNWLGRPVKAQMPARLQYSPMSSRVSQHYQRLHDNLISLILA